MHYFNQDFYFVIETDFTSVPSIKYSMNAKLNLV